MCINNIFSHVYVLNLNADLWKYDILNVKLKELDIMHQRFSAIDGNEIKDEFEHYKEKNLSTAPGFEPHKYGLFRSYGAFGVLNSYINILKDAIAHDYQNILVLQDDTYFSWNFREYFSSFYESVIKMQTDWNILYLGASQILWGRIDITGNYYLPTQHTYGLFASAFSKSIFHELLVELEKRNYQCDGVVQKLSLRYPNKSFVAYPNLVIADLTKSRTMQSRSPSESKKRKWQLNDYDIRIKYHDK